MSWKNILKVQWSDKYILHEQIRKDIVKDLNLDVESVDFKDEDMLIVKLNAKVINKYDSEPKNFSDTSIELFLDIEFRNLDLIEMKDDDETDNVVHTFNKEDIIINTDDLDLQLGINDLDFYFDDYADGKLYLWVKNI